MHLFFYMIYVTTMLAIVSDGGCGVFGHSCLGGHGKRAPVDLKPNIDDPSTRIWPDDVGQLTSSGAPIQERLNTKPLQALELESVLVFNDIPRGAEHSRYLSQEDYNN
ncbi:CCHamide-like precursor [Daphnia sinensis]|uniref:CCHamide-like n=1 Tax=Daphnia sinensis TaxID=1820382 RepID=A0AAD5PPI3_9CRUS|nr:CCHamide-like precursor [Daphnia sinensis]